MEIMPSKLRFAGVTFSVPMSWIGTALQGNAKTQFVELKNKIDVYNAYEVSSDSIVGILDLIESIKTGGYHRSVPVLNEIIHYMRVLLLSSETEIVFHSLVLLDYIVKNSGFILHIMIGRRRFMKTISWVARKHLAEVSLANKRVGNLALDCVQAWGEAFYPREEFYPHIYRTYMKLRYKYKMRFPRPDFDPTRVPIFLGEISYTEKTMANSFNNDLELNYGNLEETKEEQVETHYKDAVREVPTRPHIKPIQPPRGYTSLPAAETKSDKMLAAHQSTAPAQPDLIEFSSMGDHFFDSRMQYSDDDSGLLEQYGEHYYQLPLQSTAPASVPAFATKPSPADQVMSLYSDVPHSGTTVPSPAFRTPWDFSAPSIHTEPEPQASRDSTITSPPSSAGVTNWNIDGALDLVKLAESLPLGSGKATEKQKMHVPDKPHVSMVAQTPPTRTAPARPAVDVVAEALGEFHKKMTEAPTVPSYPPPPVPPVPPPPVPDVPPTAPPLSSHRSQPPEAPPVSLPPPPPAELHNGGAEVSRKGVSDGPGPPPLPPPLPPRSPPGMNDCSQSSQQVARASSTSSEEEDPILTLIQNMNNPDSLVQPAPTTSSTLSASASEHTRHTRTVRVQENGSTQSMQFDKTLQQQRAKLSHIPNPFTAAASDSSTTAHSDANPLDEAALPRFDPTAGPRPRALNKRAEPRKVSFAPPSSDPSNEIRYYGSQRVVIRKAASK